MSYTHDQLIQIAKEASTKAYAPYSKFFVGCAIVSKNGNVYSGCNVENISFGLTICAERNAVFQAVSKEGPELEISKVVIYTPTSDPITPCGACRQVLSEFGNTIEISCHCEGNQVVRMNIEELLPSAPAIKLKGK